MPAYKPVLLLAGAPIGPGNGPAEAIADDIPGEDAVDDGGAMGAGEAAAALENEGATGAEGRGAIGAENDGAMLPGGGGGGATLDGGGGGGALDLGGMPAAGVGDF